MPAVQRLIIDTDGGIDDAVALALAVRSPELSLTAVITSYGNNTLEAATRNVRAVLGRAGGRPIRVIPGAGTPLSGRVTPPRMAHGPTGMGHVRVDPLPSHIVPDPAALARTIVSTPAPITLITIGPFTNLAHALRSARTAVEERIRTHIALGGSGDRRLEHAHPDDFNALVDPEATGEVQRSGLRSTYIPLNVARGLMVTPDDIAATIRSPIPLAAWLSDALRPYAEYHRGHRNVFGCFLPDVTAVALAIASDAFGVRAARTNLDLDAMNEDDHRDRRLTGGHFSIAVALERERVRRLLIRVFGSVWCERKDGAI